MSDKNKKSWWKNYIELKPNIQVIFFILCFCIILSLIFFPVFIINKEEITGRYSAKYEFKKLPNFKNKRGTSSSATLLSDGKILFSGGLVDTHKSTETTEIYDPVKNKFFVSANMTDSRANHASILLKNGDVLVTGGVKYSKNNAAVELDSAEIFKAKENKFISISAMSKTMSNHKMFLLKNGNVLIVDNPYHIEIFDIKTNTFKKVKLLSSENVIFPKNFIFENLKLIIENGKKILFFYKPSIESDALFFLLDLDNLLLKQVNLNILASYKFAAVEVNKNNIMIVGGNKSAIGAGLRECSIFDIKNNVLKSCPNLNVPRYEHIVLKLDDGNILVLGGKTGFGKSCKNLKSTELYIPSQNKFFDFKNMKYSRNDIASVKLNNGNYLIYGSYNQWGLIRYTPEILIINK